MEGIHTIIGTGKPKQIRCSRTAAPRQEFCGNARLKHSSLQVTMLVFTETFYADKQQRRSHHTLAPLHILLLKERYWWTL